MRLRCVKKIRNANRAITKYTLIDLDTMGFHEIAAKEVRNLLIKNPDSFVNLKLSSNNRIIDKDDEIKSKIANKTRLTQEEITVANNMVGKLKLLGLTETKQFKFEDNYETLAKYIGTEPIVKIPPFIKRIAPMCFKESGVVEVEIPNSVETICLEAFAGCKSLKRVIGGANVESLSECAFLFCVSLTDMIKSNVLDCIPEKCYYGCTGITNILIPDSVTVIRPWAFAVTPMYNTPQLRTNVYLGKHMELVEYKAFGNRTINNIKFGDKRPAMNKTLT